MPTTKPKGKPKKAKATKGLTVKKVTVKRAQKASMVAPPPFNDPLTDLYQHYGQRRPAVEVVKERVSSKLLAEKDVVIVGCGGIGSWVIRAVTIFLRSLGVSFGFKLVDGDNYSPSNLYRCDVPGVGNKAEVWLTEIEKTFKDSGATASAFCDYLTEDNIGRVIQDGSIVFLCVDNHKTRKLVNQHCLGVKNVVLISGGNDGIDEQHNTDGTYGNVMLLVRQKGVTVAGRSLEQFHPEIKEPADKHPNEMNCMDLAMAGEPQLTFTNMAVASAMLNALLRLMMGTKDQDKLYDEVAIDVYQNKNQPIRY